MVRQKSSVKTLMETRDQTQNKIERISEWIQEIEQDSDLKERHLGAALKVAEAAQGTMNEIDKHLGTGLQK